MLTLERRYIDEMIAHAREEDPNECCGIVAGKDGKATRLYRITNTQKSPYRYNMDPKELLHAYREIEDNGWEILALYHSHPHSEAYPSQTDLRLATWPDAYYVLVSLMDKDSPDVRAFTMLDGRIDEHELRVG